MQGAAAHGPCILVHPLEGIQEVEMGSGGGGWDEERVVWSSTHVPYLVTHSGVSRRGGPMPGRHVVPHAPEFMPVLLLSCEPPPAPQHLQRHRRLAVWSITAQAAQGFVAVTPMRWPGAGGGAQAPRTPLGTAAGPLGTGMLLPTGAGPGAAAGMVTPTSRMPGGAGPAGTYKK